MKRLLNLLLTIAAIAAATSATRADELSDLVAAVAASADTVRLKADAITPAFDTRPRFKASYKGNDIDADMLDGIFRSMKRHTVRRLLREDTFEYPVWESDYQRPTLGRQGFFRPVPGILTSRFGWRPRFQRMHHGVDMALNIGDTVRAAISGTVERTSFDPEGYGHYVVVSHADGMETLYGHLQYPLVAKGQFLHAGQPLGIGGNTGNSTGPHLHFEARLGGVAVDPTILFDFYGTNTLLSDDYQTASTKQTPKTPVYTHQSKSLKKESTYIVRVGDTQESVARQAGISVMRLRQLNMLRTEEALTIGRMLKLK